MTDNSGVDKTSVSRRMTKEERRRRLLETALLVVREEGADRLTLGRLAKRACISKPVVYDHFETRSALLIELYKWIDIERVEAFRKLMTSSTRPIDETVKDLAETYIQCASDTKGEFFAVGAALAGSEEKSEVFEELLDNCVRMFASVLRPHCSFPTTELVRKCIGLVGAGEALSSRMVRGKLNEGEVVDTFCMLIHGALSAGSRTEADQRIVEA